MFMPWRCYPGVTMISASCPSCSAPVAFKHASALATICPSCESTVVRSGADVKSLGKVAKFARDLSPLQVGASGAVGKRRFEVIGAIRKGRPGVRWTEWYLAFSDGENMRVARQDGRAGRGHKPQALTVNHQWHITRQVAGIAAENMAEKAHRRP